MKGDEKMSEFYGREQFKRGYPNLYKQLKDEVRQETLKEVINIIEKKIIGISGFFETEKRNYQIKSLNGFLNLLKELSKK